MIKIAYHFDFTKLPAVNPVQPLKDFYQKNYEASDTESEYLYHEWAAIVENVPFVAYKCKVGEDKTATELNKIGYIKIPQGVNVSNKYIQVGADDLVYEARASIRNFLVLLNYLFQLNLFENEVGETPDEKTAAAFARPDFIKNYFPQLCKKLNITFKGFFEDNKDVTDIIDSKDYGLGITTKLVVGSMNIDLITEPVHCFIKITIEETKKNEPFSFWLDFIMQIIFDPTKRFFESYYYSLPYVIAYRNNSNWDTILNPKIPNIYIFNLLFYLPITNVDYVKNFIRQLDKLKIELNENAVRVLFSLVSAAQDENQKQLSKLDLYATIVRYPKWRSQEGFTGLKNSSAKDLIKLASDAVTSLTSSIQQSGLKLLKALVEKEQAYTVAIEAANDTAKSPSWGVRQSALHLFEALFEKEQGYHEAIKAATDLVRSGSSDNKTSGLNLFKAIFKQLEKISPENLTSELQGIINHAMEVGKSVDQSTPEGKEIRQLANKLEKKMAQK